MLASDEAVLDFGALQARARRTGAHAEHAAQGRPAHVIIFDVLELDGQPAMRLPYADRRALLEDLFARLDLAAPWALCPATTDPETAAEWLRPAWARVGVEGTVIKPLASPYRPGERGTWTKLRSRQTTEAIIGAVTGPLTAPTTLLLGRYDTTGHFRMVARSTHCPPRYAARPVYCSHEPDPNIPGTAPGSAPVGAPARRWSTGASGPVRSPSSRATPPSTAACGVTLFVSPESVAT